MTEANVPAADCVSIEELQLAARNHGMPLEALRYPVTPVGLHYLLIHYDIPAIDAASWRLSVTGRVRESLTLSLDDVRDHSPVTLPVTMECAGNGRARLTPRPISQPWLQEAVGNAEWTGTPVREVLKVAGLLGGAVEVLFTGSDRGVEKGVEQAYQRSLSLEEALREDVLLAYEVNGQPLPPQHGFPLRLIVPGWYGMTSVKWLAGIEVLAEPFQGYQNAGAYRFRDSEEDVGEPVTRIYPRALMVPPGVPEFFTRSRVLPLGPSFLTGRAWSGWAPIEAVEVSVDGGETWSPAQVGKAAASTAWVPWTFRWMPERTGDYVLSCRARDAAGNEQPLEPHWNVGGYANNAVQRIPATVVEQED